MQRRAINPWSWQDQFGFVQANEIRDIGRVLVVSGQTSLDADGNVGSPDDMAGQLTAAIDNLETVLKQADMTLANIVRLNFYATDMEGFLSVSHDVLSSRFAGVQYATTYLGITSLAVPGLMIEIEATAMA